MDDKERDPASCKQGNCQANHSLAPFHLIFPIQQVEQLQRINELAKCKRWRSDAVKFLVDEDSKWSHNKKGEIRMVQAIYGSEILATCSWTGLKRPKGHGQPQQYRLQNYVFVISLCVEATKMLLPDFELDDMKRVLQTLCSAAAQKTVRDKAKNNVALPLGQNSQEPQDSSPARKQARLVHLNVLVIDDAVIVPSTASERTVLDVSGGKYGHIGIEPKVQNLDIDAERVELKCRMCSRENSIDIIEGSNASYTAEDSGKKKTIVAFDCRGVEPVEFSPRSGWIAKATENGPTFDDIDLSEDDWVEYD